MRKSSADIRLNSSKTLHLDVFNDERFNRLGYRLVRDRLNGADAGTSVFVALEAESRVTFVQRLPDESALACAKFLRKAIAHYASLQIRVDCVVTDCSLKFLSKSFLDECFLLGICHQISLPQEAKNLDPAWGKDHG